MARNKKKKNPSDTGNQLVYSTSQSTQQQIDASAPSQDQRLRVRLEKNGRGGKLVSLIYGFDSNEKDLKALEKKIKSQCGTGGSTKNQEIIIQGDHVDKIVELLKKEGYVQAKRGGG